jgi:hypothetical protein
MKNLAFVAAALSASAVFVMSGSPAEAASVCRNACDKTYNQCMKGQTSKCLPSWHQCKKRCAGGASAAVATKPTPAQAAAAKALTPAQARAAASAGMTSAQSKAVVRSGGS